MFISCLAAGLWPYRHLGMTPRRGQGEPDAGMVVLPVRQERTMRDVLKTNNAVLLNFAEAVLSDAGIKAVVFDGHMSIMDGSLGILPRRLMVSDEDFTRAKAVLSGALPDVVPGN
jgi:hypothetical protein